MVNNSWVVWGQWVAVLAMTFEHAVRFALPESGALLPWSILVGRIAMPLFAGMVAWHLVYNTRDPIRYALRLLVIAALAQWPYMAVVGVSHLNVVFTLAAGVVIASASPKVFLGLSSLLVLALAVNFPASFEYGFSGVLLVPAFVLALRCRYTVACVPLLLVSWCLNESWLFSVVAVLVVFVILLINDGLFSRLSAIYRMPRRLWLFWYPLHLVLIATIAYA